VRPRPVSLALHGALLAVLVVGPMAYVSAGKSVRLAADGSERDVRTYAGTVGEVLKQQGIAFGPHDTVAPGLATRLVDGMQVGVLHGRPVHLVVDGVARDVWTTSSSVNGLVAMLGARFRQAYLSVSRFAPIPLRGLSVDVRLPKSVTVVYGGSPAVLVTTAVSWSAALAQAGLPFGPNAVLSVPATSAPLPGQHVSVWLTGTRLVNRLVPIPYATATTPSAAMYVGTSRVLTPGRTGSWRQTWRYTLRDGRLVRARLLNSRVAVNPVTEVVAVGTRTHAVVAASRGYPRTSVDQLDWSSLAQCESGGNPRAVGGGGVYFGLYQFRLSTWQAIGGLGNPVSASATEQTYRAQILYLRDGDGAWPYCGQYL
jgi:resuscitation-promoting factor RpfB